MKNFSPTMRDIKMILQKNDLQICRAKRVRWGPYSLGALVPGEVNIMPMTIPLKKKVIDLKNKRLKVQDVQKLERDMQDIESDENALSKYETHHKTADF